MNNQWLSTSKAAKHFGISPDTLKRWGRPKTGFLREGVHWKRGMKVSHPHDRNIASDADALQAAGFQWEADELRRKADIAEMQRINERIDESRLLQQQDAQKREQWQSMGLLERLGHTPIDPAVAAANRRKWGIKGR